MHPGNIFVDVTDPQNPRYIAIDCAIMGSLSSDDQFYMARNLLAIFERDYRQVAELHVRSGWVPKDTSIVEFTSAIRAVCEPIFERPLRDISLGHMLISLFTTARKFNMQVQPSLVLLQKTLLNIEGLGRQLYPELDLWTTAQPFLQQWLRDRYSPKSIYRQFKQQLPDLLEHLPKIPPLLYQAIENFQQPTEDLPSNSKEHPSKKASRAKIFGTVITGAGIGLFAAKWVAAIGPTTGIGALIAGIGLLILLSHESIN
jgi:ubiquinone biosynthesis protein